jgi:plasmid stabilization system protein ParE
VSKLRVVLHPRVYDELDDAYLWWAKNRSPLQAGRWFRGIWAAIQKLTTKPEHHPLAIENDRFPNEVRELRFGLGRRPSHRVLFSIRPDCIFVFKLRHVSQDAVDPDDL